VALVHDADEAVTGDLPTPTKPMNTDNATLDKCVLKIADCLEAALFLSEELSMGNSSIADILDDVISRGSMWTKKMSTMCNDPDITFMVLFDELMQITNPSYHPGMME